MRMANVEFLDSDLHILNFSADVAELADAQVSGTCGLSPCRFDSYHPHSTCYNIMRPVPALNEPKP